MSFTPKKALATSGIALAAVNVAFVAPLMASGQTGWTLLGATDDAVGSDTVSADAKSGVYELTGYIGIMTANADVQEFMLFSDMGLCPWCGEAGHGATMAVTLADPVTGLQDGQRVTVRGLLEEAPSAASDGKNRMVNAELL